MDREALRQFLAVSDLLGLARRFAAIEGWISDIEGYVLYRLARGREPVHAVDTFEGSPAHQATADTAPLKRLMGVARISVTWKKGA
jgi:hypothetical protein